MRGRLLAFESFDAAMNMSIDEAISLSVAAEEQPPTLRFYGWRKPTLSLGYFQKHAESDAYLTAQRCQQADSDILEIVRRSTGGGAILHHHELTYSLSLPLGDTGPGPREFVYQAVHQSIRDSLARSAVQARPFRESVQRTDDESEHSVGLLKKTDEAFLCFQRRTSEDLICNGYKILGSAQRRVRGGVLQHGSLLLSVSPWAGVLPGVSELTNVDINLEEFSLDVANRLGHELTIEFKTGAFSRAEIEAADRITNQRYAAAEWTRRR